MFANGSENNLKENWDWQHTLYKGKPAGYSIIGYRKKPVLTPASDDAFDVSKFALVQKMTEAEFQNRFSGGSLTPLEVGRELGIIRKETLLEQFELEHPNIVVGPVSRVVAQAAIEWMENKK